jgi:hypothetical protein
VGTTGSTLKNVLHDIDNFEADDLARCSRSKQI